MIAHDGTLTTKTVDHTSGNCRLVNVTRTTGRDARVTSLRLTPLQSPVGALTAGQRVLFRQAPAVGDYDVPRLIALTSLAKKISRSRTSVSRRLAAIERKLLEVGYRSVG